MEYQDLLYQVRNRVAWITINRPDKMNAFRGTTCDELIDALYRAGYDRERPDAFARVLRAAKRELDPRGVLNPGVLIDA